MTKYEKLARWIFEQIVDGQMIDGFDVQEKMEEFGIIEQRNVEPDENVWGSDYLYFWKTDD